MAHHDDRSARFPIGAAVTLEQLEVDPYPVLAELARREPVSWIPGFGGWLVTGRAVAVEVLRDADRFTVDDPRFTTAAVVGPSMLSLDGVEHVRHRTPFAPPFRPAVVRDRFDRFLHEEARRLVRVMQQAGHRELRTGLAGPLAVGSITRMLGLDELAPHDVLRWYRSISQAVVDLTRGRPVAPDSRAAVAALDQQVRTVMGGGIGTDGLGRQRDRLAQPSVIREAVRSGSLSEAEVVSNVAVIMFGAIETAEGMTANALWHLLSHSGAWEAVRTDPDLVGPAIEESLRLEPAAAVVDRYTTTDVELAGVEIPARELVTTSLLAANRDPGLFDRPDEFDPTRPNAGRHLSFVQGPHRCLGLHLARRETAAAIDALLDLAPQLALDPESSRGPRGLIFRKPPAVAVHWAGLPDGSRRPIR